MYRLTISSFFSIIRNLLLFYGLFVPFSGFAQALNFKQTNYTIADGLPSNECHDIVQDSLGYIWIATDRGLVKFNGYEFKTYGFSDGLEDISCLNIKIDRHQNIWILTLSGRLFRYDKAKDSLSIYKYQDHLNKLFHLIKIHDFDLSDNGGISFVFLGIGILTISVDGDVILKRGNIIEDIEIVCTKVTDNGLLISVNSNNGPPDYTYRNGIKKIKYVEYYACDYQIQHGDITIEGIRDPSINNLNFEAFRINPFVDLISIYGVDYHVNEDTVIVRMHQSEIENITVANDTSYITTEVNQKGVNFYKNYDSLLEDKHSILIPNVSATHSIIDVDGGIWVTTLNQGLFKLDQKQIITVDETKGNKVTSIERFQNNLCYVKENNALYKYILNEEDSLLLYDSSNRIQSLTCDHHSKEMIVCKYPSVRLNTSYNSLPIFCHNELGGISVSNSNNAFVFSDKYFLSGANYLMIYDDLDSLEKNNRFEIRFKKRILGAALVSDNNYLLGTENGLIQFKDGEFIRLSNRPYILRSRINDIKKYGDDYLIATQGNGLVLWDMKSKLKQLTKSNGLLSDNIDQVFIDRNEDIYLSTKSGLGKLWFDASDSLVIRNYTTFHGLPSNEVNDIARLEDSLYIATGGGLAILAGEQALAARQTIRIEKVEINGRAKQIEDEGVYSHLENSVFIEYKTLDYDMLGKIPYRYKLNDRPWTSTQSTFANFSSLSPGQYVFNVQSKNFDDIWSESAIISFTISLPWWRTWRFYGLGFCVVLLLGFMGYKRRTEYLKNRIKVEREIRELERAALQAQMNPHFIFNCLNSIQRYLMDADKENAMEYLAKFATLIRQSLNASSENKISLDQEIMMLQNYLDMEKLRFKDKFEYQIFIDGAVTPEEISIPPLLVQPYVENSIIHGMNGMDIGGLITIRFTRVSYHQIQVKITDNGQPVSQPSRAKDLDHKSLGMSITSKRLAHNNKLRDDSILIEPNYSQEGTEVVITISI